MSEGLQTQPCQHTPLTPWQGSMAELGDATVGPQSWGRWGAGRVPAPTAMPVAEHGFQGVRAQELGCMGLVALWHGFGGGSSQTRDRTCVPCVVLSTVLRGKTRRWFFNVERSWPTPAFERCPAQGREPGPRASLWSPPVLKCSSVSCTCVLILSPAVQF